MNDELIAEETEAEPESGADLSTPEMGVDIVEQLDSPLEQVVDPGSESAYESEVSVDRRSFYDWRKMIPSGITDPVTNNEIRTSVSSRKKYRLLDPNRIVTYIDPVTKQQKTGRLGGAPNEFVTKALAEEFSASSGRNRHEFGPGKYGETMEIRLKVRNNANYFNVFISSIKDGYIDIIKLAQAWKKPKKGPGRVERAGVVDEHTGNNIYVSSKTRRLFREDEEYGKIRNKELNVIIGNIFSSSGPALHTFTLDDGFSAEIRRISSQVGKNSVFISKITESNIIILTLQETWKKPDSK